MKQYKVFRHPSGTSEAVKQGWSWPAFFFIFIWAMVKKMWGLGVGVLIGSLVLEFILNTAVGTAGGGADGIVGGVEGGKLLPSIVSFVVNVILGVNGNSWREKNLVSRGFEHMDTVTAANPEGAMALYLKAAKAYDTELNQHQQATLSNVRNNDKNAQQPPAIKNGTFRRSTWLAVASLMLIIFLAIYITKQSQLAKDQGAQSAADLSRLLKSVGQPSP